MESLQSNNKEFLATDPIGPLLKKLSIPAVAAQMVNMLYNVVDRIYIGHIPEVGGLALTGVGLCLPLIMTVSAFAGLIGSGGAPRVSIAMGRGNMERAEKTLGNCFTMLLMVSALLTVLLLTASKPLLYAFGASDNTILYAVDYMNIYALGTLLVQLTLGLNPFITAQGFAKNAMVSVFIGAIANILLDPLFIFVFHMGVKGAAVATILAQALSAVYILRFLFGPKTLLRIRREHLRLKKTIVVPVLSLGMSFFIMTFTESVIAVCFNASLLKYGGDLAVGAITILTSVMQFAMLPLEGLGQGAQPILSYNFGAEKPERVRETFRLLLKISLIYSGTLWALIMVFPRAFARMFTSDAALIAYTTPALRIFFATLGFFGIQMACQMAFTALGNYRSSILSAVMRKIVFLIPLIYILPALFPGSPVVAVYSAEPIADLMAVTFTGFLFKSQFKKDLHTIERGQ